MASIKGPIKTIVVLVMENRSFDHMLGWFNRINPEIDGLQATYCNPLNTSDPNSEQVYVSDAAEYVDPDPGHSFQAIRQQIFGRDDDTSADPPPMNGFAQQAESEQKGLSKRVMSAFKPEALPSYKKLVEEFAVCDRWFCSIPTSTQPNRMYVQSATSHGAISNRRSDLLKGFPQKTIFESVYEAGLSIGIYYQNIPAVLFLRNLRKVKYLVHFHDYDLSFKKHASEGKLPNYSVVEQRYFNHSIFPASDDHPPHDVRQGQKLIKDVYDTLRASPQWNETLFVITYDEHGGYYDHVPTPVKNVPNPDDIDAQTDPPFKFDRLGVRVPAIFVSPWIEKGTVLHKPDGPTPDSEYEHSSIPATVRKLFNLEAPLTKRDEWAGTFDNVINMTSPRTDCPETLTNLDDELNAGDENTLLSEFQKELVLLASLLKGDKSNPDPGNGMKVNDAKKYVDSTTEEFIRSGCHAFHTKQCNPDHIWELPRETCFSNCCFPCFSS